jgi:hypothetical protein
MNFTDAFVAKGCSKDGAGVPAVTLGAAEQWIGGVHFYDAHGRSS